MFFVQGDVFNSQGATAHCVGLIFVLLVSSSQSELVDEIQSNCSLANPHFLRLEVYGVIFSYLSNFGLKTPKISKGSCKHQPRC